MARPYSRRLLASLIASGRDTASAAAVFGRSIEFIQREQQTPQYATYLEQFLKKTQAPRTTSSRQTTSETTEGENAEIQIEDTDDGVRIRGKSGGEEEFEEWHDIRDGKDGSKKFYSLEPPQPPLPPVYYDMNPFPHKELNPFLEPLKPFGDPLNPEPDELDGVGVTELLEGVEQLVDRRLFELISKYFMPKLDGIEDNATRDQSGQEMVALMSALMGGDQLSWHALKDRPAIPVDTTLWQDIFRVRTAYTAGHVVLVEGGPSTDDRVYIYTEDVPDTNTVQPADDPRAHAINIGAPDTVVSLTATATETGIQLIATHRDGTKHTQNIYITPYFYTKTQVDARFAKLNHNHNTLYFSKDPCLLYTSPSPRDS